MFFKKILILCCVFCTTYATQCEESACWSGNIGVGGAYYDFGSADISSYGGFLALEARGIYRQRLQAVIGGRIGGGSTQSDKLPLLESKSPLFIIDEYVKFGVNIAGKNAPLFINLVLEENNHNGNIASHNGIDRTLITLGGELEGSFNISSLTQFNYSLGYAWVGSGQYIIDDIKSKVENYSDEINVSVGFTRTMTENLGFYMKLRGKYQNLQKALYQNIERFPSTRNFVAMVEMGLKI